MDVAGIRVRLVGEGGELVLVHRPVERLAELDVLEHRVAERRPLVAVERQVVERLLRARLGGETLLALQRLDLRRRDVDGEVDGAELEVLRQRVLVVVHLEDDLVDLGLAAPVVLVGHGADELALLALRDHERARADDRRLVEVLGGLVVGLELAPDVLGDDGDPHGEDVGLGPVALDDHGGVVGRGDRLDAVERREEGGELEVLLVVEAEGDVLGRQRLAVTPHHALADLERPGETVLARGPALREAGLGLEVLVAVVGEEVVGHVVQLVAGLLDADEGVQVVGVGGPADLEHDRVAGRRRARVAGDRPREAPDEAGGQRQDDEKDEGFVRVADALP